MLVGIFSGWVYYKTRNILPSIVIHATNNLIPVLMIFFQDSNEAQEETMVEMYGGVLNLSLIISLCLIVIAVGIYYLNKEFNKQKQEVPLG